MKFKKENERKLKEDQLFTDRQRIDAQLSKEYQEEAFNKLKSQREK